jgi:alpha-tubulin suppressor-like RCC1 family protein
VVCWRGRSDRSTPDDPAPTPISGIDNAIDLALGPTHQCALLRGGGAKCWGDNGHGELGDGTTDSSDVPVAVQGL